MQRKKEKQKRKEKRKEIKRNKTKQCESLGITAYK